MCICQRCGRFYQIDLNIPDELWNQIRPRNKDSSGGLICGSCIMLKLEHLLEYAAFELVEVK